MSAAIDESQTMLFGSVGAEQHLGRLPMRDQSAVDGIAIIRTQHRCRLVKLVADLSRQARWQMIKQFRPALRRDACDGRGQATPERARHH